MGQIFHACAYDIENKICCKVNADKFHANCYSYSGAVFSMHYLLRQKPYRIMWGGDYVVVADAVKSVSRQEDLLGLSTYLSYEDFDRNNDDIKSESYYDKVKFIGENFGTWEKLNVWDESLKYFDWENTYSVRYEGYLINHTKKLAVDLEDYYKQSQFFTAKNEPLTIDLVPVLTETGGGSGMAMFDGVSVESTEELFGTWMGDLLQIVDELPDGYQIINCCFAELWNRAKYCYRKFGVDQFHLVLKDDNGNRFVGVEFYPIPEDRAHESYVKVVKTDNDIKYTLVKTADDRP